MQAPVVDCPAREHEGSSAAAATPASILSAVPAGAPIHPICGAPIHPICVARPAKEGRKEGRKGEGADAPPARRAMAAGLGVRPADAAPILPREHGGRSYLHRRQGLQEAGKRRRLVRGGSGRDPARPLTHSVDATAQDCTCRFNSMSFSAKDGWIYDKPSMPMRSAPRDMVYMNGIREKANIRRK